MITELKKELENTKIENDLLKTLFDFSNEEDDNKIKIGCRVQILYEDGKTQLGRVVKLSQDRKHWMINRDGYASTIGIPSNRIKLVYSGVKKHIDIKLWENENRIYELEEILQNSELPPYFIDKEYVNIKVISKSEPRFGYCIISCEIFSFNPAQKIKVPFSTIDTGRYFQLHIRDRNIINILPISKERYQNQE